MSHDRQFLLGTSATASYGTRKRREEEDPLSIRVSRAARNPRRKMCPCQSQSPTTVLQDNREGSFLLDAHGSVAARPRVAVVGIFHESNSFSSAVADISRFRITRGQDMLKQGKSKSVVAGFVNGAAAQGLSLQPLMRASSRRASPKANARDLHPTERIGAIAADTYDALSQEISQLLRSGGPWDGVLIANHGAAVSEQHPDMDGAFCAMVRETVGDEAVIGICLDMHANVSQQVVEKTDVCVVWRTTPHVDMYERGVTTATLVGRAIRGEISPVQWIETPPMIVNVTKHFTDVEPMLSVCNDCIAVVNDRGCEGILDASVALGSPYVDAHHMGTSFIVLADGNVSAAKRAARWIASRAWDQRDRLCTPGPARAYGTPDMPGTESCVSAPQLTAQVAVRTADQQHAEMSRTIANETVGPVVIMDVGDNIRGGSPGDSTFLLNAALDQGVRGFLQTLVDPEAVASCVKAGVGAVVHNVPVGGKSDTLHGTPVFVTGTVQSLSDGEWYDPGPVHGGARAFSAGTCACLTVAKGCITLVLTSKRCDNTSRGIYNQIGLQPELFRVIVAKGVESPRASFASIASSILMANTPGITSVDMTSFVFKHRRVPLYPFELETKFDTGDQVEGY